MRGGSSKRGGGAAAGGSTGGDDSVELSPLASGLRSGALAQLGRRSGGYGALDAARADAASEWQSGSTGGYGGGDDGDDNGAGGLLDPFKAKGVPRAPYAALSRSRGVCARVPPRLRVPLILLTVLAVLIGCGVPAGVYIAGPLIAKAALDGTKLQFLSMTLTAPYLSAAAAEDGRLGAVGGFTLAATVRMSGLSVSGELADLPLTLSVGGADVLTFTLPGQAAVAGQDLVITATLPVAVVSLPGFAAFAQALLASATAVVHLRGSATLSTTVAGITITMRNVPFDKDVPVPGANGLRGAAVTAFSLGGSNSTTAVVNMTVAVPNVSPVGIYPLGDFGAGVFYRGVRLGSARAVNVSLAPSGVTSVQMTGELDPAVGPVAQAAASELVGAYLAGRAVNVTAVGEPTGSSIPLYAPLISALNITAALAGSATPLVAGITVHSLDLAPLSPTTLDVGLSATVSINSPLGPDSPLAVNAVALNVSLEGSGAIVGRLTAPLTPQAPTDDAGAAAAAAGSRPLLALHQLLPPGTRLAWSAAPGLVEGYALAVASGADDATLPLLEPAVVGDAPPPQTAVVNVSVALSGATLTINEDPGGGGSSPFGRFIVDFINSPDVSLGLVTANDTGSGAAATALTVALTSVLGDLTVGVPLEARTTVAGINRFPYVAVDGFTVQGVRDATADAPAAILVQLFVTIGNPSSASFPLGDNATLGVYSAGYRIGAAVAVNQTLRPGLNAFTLNGTLTPPPASLPYASAFFSDYLNGVNGSVTVVGEDVSLAGGTPQWLLAAVRNISLAASLPGAVGLDVLTDFAFDRLDLSFTDDGAGNQVPVMGGQITAAVHLPFSIPVSIPAADVALTLVNVTSGVRFAQLNLTNQPGAFTPCAPGAGNDPCARFPPGGGNAPVVGVLAMALTPTRLAVLDFDATAALVSAVLLGPSAQLRLDGLANPTVGTAVGNLSITGVRVSQVVTVGGMGGFAATPPSVYDVVITKTTPQYMNISVKLNLTNPSPVHGSLGPVSLGLAYRGLVISRATVDNLEVWPGNNTLAAHGNFELPDPDTDPAAHAIASEFIARYLSKLTSPVALVGDADSSPIPLVAPALTAFSVASLFPPIEQGLLVNATMWLDYTLGSPIPVYANGSLFMANSLDVPLTLLNASINMWLCPDQDLPARRCKVPWSVPVGYFYDGNLSEARSGYPSTPPRTVASTYSYDIKLVGTESDSALVFLEAALGGAVSKANGTITVSVGELVFRDVMFEQEGVVLLVGPSSGARFPSPSPAARARALLRAPPPADAAAPGAATAAAAETTAGLRR
jgi:hypothetical protein